MSALSVVHYNTSPHKLNILQHSASVNTNTTERREIIIVRKTTPQITPHQKQDILLTNTAKKRPKTGKETARVHNPPPVAVARRNARERNRVKQVNNGFATLRQHIPNSIAAAFESSSGRGGNKKLSKVETLRMAVEYIRSLEEMLAMDDSSEYSTVSYPSPSPSSPSFATKSTATYSYSITSPSVDEDDLSTNPTPPPQQYIRIQGSNLYQLVPAHLYEDNTENLEPLDVDDQILSDPSLIDADFSGVQDLSLLTSESLSPDMYSDQSSSPGRVKAEPQQTYIPVFGGQMSPTMGQTEVKLEAPVISLGHEEEMPEDDKKNVIDVISWWEQQQRS